LGPAIVLGVLKTWWVGVVAYLAIFVLKFVLGWGMLSVVPPRFLELWGYAKNLLVGLAVLVVGLWVL
jgi:fucose permease